MNQPCSIERITIHRYVSASPTRSDRFKCMLRLFGRGELRPEIPRQSRGESSPHARGSFDSVLGLRNPCDLSGPSPSSSSSSRVLVNQPVPDINETDTYTVAHITLIRCSFNDHLLIMPRADVYLKLSTLRQHLSHSTWP